MMNVKTRIALLTLASLILAAFPATAAIAEDAPPGAAPAPAPKPAGKPALDKGMTAEAVIALIGKPQDVRPMTVAEGKAEVWTYRRLIDEQIRQNAASVAMIPIYMGPGMGGHMGTTPDPEFHLEHVKTYQVTTLLMFGGKLVLARQWREQSRSFEQ